MPKLGFSVSAITAGVALIAFFVAGVATFALDLVQWEYARPEPLIQGVLDYYAVALGPTPPLRRGLRLLALSAVAVGASAAVAFPLVVKFVIWMHGLND